MMPEPATVALLSTGCGALFVQYARRRYHRGKAIFDRLAGLLLLILLGPFILLFAALIRISSRGPAFFHQERVGQNGRLFRIVKLRTMRLNAESVTGPVWATSQDVRVSQIGRILRVMHFDELPQLWNVVRGEMSLVGPRPERPYFVERLRTALPDYDHRLHLKPGITGLAQIRAGYDRSLRDVRRKVKLDLVYMSRMCWWVDFSILVRTVGRVLDFLKEERSRVK